MENKYRCQWCIGSELMIEYHDKEWGTPVHKDGVLFEFLILEGAQAGRERGAQIKSIELQDFVPDARLLLRK